MGNKKGVGQLTGLQRSILLNQALEARSMHQLWMARGYSFLAGKPVDFPPEFAERDDMCPIGNWLRDRLDSTFKALELYGRTCALHDDFHQALGRLFREDIDRVSGPARALFQRKGDELTAAIEEWVSLARAVETP